VNGYVMRRIEGEPLSEILENELDAYINLPLEVRLGLCSASAGNGESVPPLR